MRILSSFFVLLSLASPALAAETFDDPVRLVEYAYQRYVGEEPPGFDEMALYSPRLLDLFAQEEALGELGGLVFDPYVNAQEEDVSDLTIALSDADETRAQVAVGFSNGGTYEHLMFTLVPAPDGYKIDEIESVEPGHEWTLSDILATPL